MLGEGIAVAPRRPWSDHCGSHAISSLVPELDPVRGRRVCANHGGGGPVSVALLWACIISSNLYERRLGLLYLSPGLHGVDPFPDAFDDCGMSGDCFYSIGQDVKID